MTIRIIPEQKDPRYWYGAEIHSIYDGDSLRLNIDMGFETWRNRQSFRLAHIDAWEIRGEERPMGLKAKEFIKKHLDVGERVLIRTIKDTRGKYGRILVEVYDMESGQCINDLLVAGGHAVYKEY